MLILETVVRIRREHADGKSIKAIARDLRLSRKVVRKAIRAPEAGFAYQRTVQPLPRLGPFQERLDALLVENESRPRRERLRMTRNHDLLVREGPLTSSGEPLTVSYDAVRRYAARWLRERRKDAGDGASAFIPGQGLPVRVEPRGRRDRWQADAGEGRTCLHRPFQLAHAGFGPRMAQYRRMRDGRIFSKGSTRGGLHG
jgi:hypothetical protein